VLTSVGPSGTVTVWDADTFTRTAELHGHTGYVQSITVSREGRAVTGSVDGTARIWDLESRRELTTLRGHTGPINSVAVSPDGALVATAGADGMAKLWDAATGREVLTLFGHEKTFTPSRSAPTVGCSPPPASTGQWPCTCCPSTSSGSWQASG
jgi:WD40 repeat protein